jgi:hypothetical protein
LGIEDYEIEVEYQAETIGKYDLGFNGKDFTLLNKLTACLAEDQCGIARKTKVKLSEISNQNNALQVEVVANLNFNTKMMPSKHKFSLQLKRKYYPFIQKYYTRT